MEKLLCDGFVDAFVGRGSENKVNTILPLNDLDDMEKINISDVMSGDPGRIAGASSRYTQGIAVAGLLTSGNSGLQFTYHIVDVSTAKKLFSGTVEGGINNITTKFYEDLRTAMGNQKTSGNSYAKENLKIPFSFAPAHLARQSAGAVGALAMQLFKQGKYVRAEEHAPIYLRKSQAEQERERALGNSNAGC